MSRDSFVVICWKKGGVSYSNSDLPARLRDAGYTNLVENSVLSIFADTDSCRITARQTEHGTAFVVGTGFTRSGAIIKLGPECSDQDRATFRDVQSGHGERVMRAIWGGYVIGSVNGHGDGWILRDPMGSLPLFRYDSGSAILLFSTAEALRTCVPNRAFKPNPGYLRVEDLVPAVKKSVSPLDGIEEILPGQGIGLGANSGQQSLFWNPAEHCKHLIYDHDEAIARIRDSVNLVAKSYASLSGKLSVYVGGLDSSIIWQTLDRIAPDATTGITHFSDDALGDERSYVQQLSNSSKISQVRIGVEGLTADRLLQPVGSVAPPSFVDLTFLAEASQTDCAIDQELFICGVGGDNVFQKFSDGAAFEDLVKLGHKGRGRLSRYLESVRRTGRSAPDLLISSLRSRLNPQSETLRTLKSLSPPNLLFEDHGEWSLDNLDTALHPMLRFGPEIPYGKALQIMTTCFFATEGGGPYWPHKGSQISFYLAQPIVETCLSIATSTLTMNGIERGLARQSFHAILPDAVARRLNKGTPETLYGDFIKSNFCDIEDYLANGKLVEYGLIGKDIINSRKQRNIYASQIVRLIGYENWLRYWS